MVLEIVADPSPPAWLPRRAASAAAPLAARARSFALAAAAVTVARAAEGVASRCLRRCELRGCKRGGDDAVERCGSCAAPFHPACLPAHARVSAAADEPGASDADGVLAALRKRPRALSSCAEPTDDDDAPGDRAAKRQRTEAVAGCPECAPNSFGPLISSLIFELPETVLQTTWLGGIVEPVQLSVGFVDHPKYSSSRLPKVQPKTRKSRRLQPAAKASEFSFTLCLRPETAATDTDSSSDAVAAHDLFRFTLEPDECRLHDLSPFNPFIQGVRSLVEETTMRTGLSLLWCSMLLQSSGQTLVNPVFLPGGCLAFNIHLAQHWIRDSARPDIPFVGDGGGIPMNRHAGVVRADLVIMFLHNLILPPRLDPLPQLESMVATAPLDENEFLEALALFDDPLVEALERGKGTALQQPAEVVTPLLPYQLRCLGWMLARERTYGLVDDPLWETIDIQGNFTQFSEASSAAFVDPSSMDLDPVDRSNAPSTGLARLFYERLSGNLSTTRPQIFGDISGSQVLFCPCLYSVNQRFAFLRFETQVKEIRK
jgi:hypothetical protein